jgi:tRNA(Ile)-lysidine synthase
MISADSKMDPLILKIKKTLADHAMIEQGDSVLLAVSGGPDSIALLWGMLELRERLNIELTIAHLNHCAREAESDSDARFVKELGGKLQVDTFIEKVDVAKVQAVSKNSFQETARDIRLEFLQRIMSQTGANKIALGHTLDDQAETVLMNLLRGSGLKGMGGMNPVRSPYIRPLFNCSRSDVIEFLKNKKVSYCEDSSNKKTDYLRNRIRLELIPFLQKQYNPRIVENLFDASGIFRADNDCLDALEHREFDRIVLKSGDNCTLTIDLESFAVLPLALKRRLIRRVIQELKGDLRRISLVHIEDALNLFDKSQKEKRIDLPDNVEVLCRGDRVEFKRISETDSRILSCDEDMVSDWVKRLKIPGDTQIEKSDLTLKAEIINPSGTGFVVDQDNQAFLDFDKTGDNILIRFFQAGDRLQPLGMKGTKKLKALFIDEKVPQEARSTIPILTTGNNDIIWVYGTRIADSFRVTSNTSKVLFIKGLP